jgi:hypothetical protein
MLRYYSFMALCLSRSSISFWISFFSFSRSRYSSIFSICSLRFLSASFAAFSISIFLSSSARHHRYSSSLFSRLTSSSRCILFQLSSDSLA